MKKIGVIGSGGVGKTLANGFLKHGYLVKIGSRDLTKLKEWDEACGEEGTIGSFEEAAGFGELIVLAVKGVYAKNALKIAGKGIDGKTIIDATNPIDDSSPAENGVLKFFTSLDRSLMEELQSSYPAANFVKAFSCIGGHLMVNPQLSSGLKPSMFIAGNNEAAKKEVAQILDLFGHEVEDMGTEEAARAIEPLSMLWCIPGFRDNQWSHAFKLIR